MGISCPFSSNGEDNKFTIKFNTHRNNIPQENFFKIIPKSILEQMNNDNILFENYHKDNSLEMTIRFQEHNITDNNEIFYHGEFNNQNEKEGLGKMVIINAKNEKIYYYGIWQKNELRNGIIYYSSKSKYKGEIKDYKREGKGEYISEDETYEGEWKDDYKDGEGLIKFKDNIEYKGHFKKNKIHGKGEMNWPDGTYYSGDFYDNIFHGEGYLKGSNNHIYHGNFNKGLYNGYGEFEWTKGVESIKYKGNYLAGKKDGRGELFFKNGNVYRGGWESGTPHGEGVFETKNRKYYGNWRSGIFMQLIKVENKEDCQEEKINLNFYTPIEDIEIKGNFKLSTNSVFSSSTFNTYNEVLVEVVKQS